MTTPTKSGSGFVVIGGVPYRRSRFVAQRGTSLHDWLLFSMIVLSLVVSIAIVIGAVVLVAWAAVEAVQHVVRQLR